MSKVVIRAELIPGHHDALIEALGQHGPRAGNQMVFSISAACQKQWPVTLSDFTPPAHSDERAVEVKMTLREDYYPELFRLYKGLGHGNRQTVFLNMLNRHVSLSFGAPEAVMQAMTDYALARSCPESTRTVLSQDAAAGVAEPSGNPRPDEPVGHTNSVASAISAAPQDVTPEPPAPLFVPDPMASVDIGL